MIRECNASDLETLEAYLKEEVYGKVILSLIEKNGFEQAAQSVYGDFEEGVCKGVYLCIYKNLLLYCKENQVDIDFLEQIVSMQVPEVVAGRPDNVNVISWLLTDYRQERQLPCRNFWIRRGSRWSPTRNAAEQLKKAGVFC